MKVSLIIILLFLIFSCNSSTEQGAVSTDSPITIPVDSVVVYQPVISTEEKLINNLQCFAKEKIDSIGVDDILEVVKDILETLHEASETDDWEKASEYYEKTASAMKQSEKGTDIFNKNQSDFNKIKTKIEEHRLEAFKADRNLKKISSGSRWEKIRKTFQRKLYEGEFTQFSNEQQNDFKQVLADWDSYKETNKLSWLRNGEDNLEDLFFNFSKDNGKVKAAWGYMIQQVDWDGAVHYFTNIAPDAEAMGKPYFTLKYYYNTINRGAEFESFYDNATNESVGDLCPPVH